MALPADVRFTNSHEWARKEGDLIVVGVSDFAIEQMNKEITYLELPEAGKTLGKGQTFGIIESVKSANDMYAPVGGTVVEVNTAAADDIALVTDNPYSTGWLLKLKPSDPSEFEALMTAEDYQKFIDSGAGH